MTHEYRDDRQRQLISIVKAKSTSTHIPEKMFDMASARARRRYKEADKGGVERGTRAAVFAVFGCVGGSVVEVSLSWLCIRTASSGRAIDASSLVTREGGQEVSR